MKFLKSFEPGPISLEVAIYASFFTLMLKETYIQLAIREFRRTKALADGAMSQASAAQFFAVPSPTDNSIAIVVKHVGGNLLSRWTDFLASDGEKPGRNRDAEFELTRADTRERLMGQWEAGWGALFSALEPLSDSELERTIRIRGEPLTVLQAINRQLTHYAYHVAQLKHTERQVSRVQCESHQVRRASLREGRYGARRARILR